MTSTITQCVDQISSALRTLSELFADPSALAFDDVRRDMERLEEQCKKKATIDAAFAFIAERDEAGRIVGANYPNAYLQQRLDLSKARPTTASSAAVSSSLPHRSRRLTTTPLPTPRPPTTSSTILLKTGSGSSRMMPAGTRRG